MFVVEVVLPGSWITPPESAAGNEDWDIEVGALLDLMKSLLIDANIAINGMKRMQVLINSCERLSDRAERQRALSKQLRETIDIDDDDFNLQLTKLDVRERAAAGVLPRLMHQHELLVFSRTYVSAIDLFGKSLTALCEMPFVPGCLNDIRREFEDRFPQIRAIRNTHQHLEERVVRIGSKGKKIPTTTPLVIDNFFGETLHCTSGDGSVQTVDISTAALADAAGFLQRVLNAFSWRGFPHMLIF